MSRLRYNTNADYVISGGATLAALDNAYYQQRIECSGVPIRVKLTGSAYCGNGGELLYGIAVDGTVPTGANQAQGASGGNGESSGFQSGILYEYVLAAPSPGSHLFQMQVGKNGSSLTQIGATSPYGVALIIEELLSQNASNGTA